VSIFVSLEDYQNYANECEQLSYEICGHTYKLLCKKDKIEQAKNIIEKIIPIIEKIKQKNNMIPFDKILFMSMIEILSKEKEFKTNQQNEQDKPITNKNEFEIEKQNLINDFIEILKTINNELDIENTQNTNDK